MVGKLEAKDNSYIGKSVCVGQLVGPGWIVDGMNPTVGWSILRSVKDAASQAIVVLSEEMWSALEAVISNLSWSSLSL